MKIFFYLLSILTLFISCREEPEKCCSCIEAEGMTDKYTFPVVPGMIEWKQLKSHQEMVDVCQIPARILEQMCTAGLVDTYYDYPILFTIFAFNNIEEGVTQIATEFNGFGEVLTREDCATKFLLKYEPISPADIDSSWTSIERGNFKQLFMLMEVTLSYDPICSKYTETERKRLIRIALEKLELKEKYGYSGPSLITNIYLIGNLLQKEGYTPFLDFLEARVDLRSFLAGNLNNLQYVGDGHMIKSFAKSFLDQI
jgi:hypothetical protein